ncbi:MAG TPA: hypothetical protein VLS45_03615 [Methylomicrobium sp.]|nr:hypothetical protein [Methylomicrobium sp.]
MDKLNYASAAAADNVHFHAVQLARETPAVHATSFLAAGKLADLA